VEFLRLASGLLLPWLCGAVWLAFLEARLRPGQPGNRLRQAGYGFFVGQALLCLLILAINALMGEVLWGWIASLLLVLAAAAGFGLWRLPHARQLSATARYPEISGPERLLLVVVAAWTLLHLLFVSVEALNQPLYPWDAWLAWVYRAKAWFLAGGLVDIVGPGSWAAAASPEVYTIDAWQYPPLPSLVPYWAALSLGRWSETLISLPAVLAGLAIGLGIYGQCRESGMSPLLALIACYLLFSIPLFGTHIALAGYADLWMAGFTGLGFMALLRGTIFSIRFQTMLGFCLLALATLVKNEGIVWFLAAMLLHAMITWRARAVILLLAILIAPVLAAIILGVPYFEIPLIGSVGLVNGQLQLPFLRHFKLEMHNVWGPYGQNFFLLGNWHLLWLLVAAGLLVAVFWRRNLERSARLGGAAFILTFLATQLFIFGLTDQGLWADAYTAINRLPLHFLPALIFTPLLLLNASLPRGVALLDENSAAMPGRGWRPNRLFLAAAIAAALVSAALLGLTARDLPAETAVAKRFTATDLEFVMGGGRVEGEGLVVERFANGYALLSSGSLAVAASDYPNLRFALDPRDSRKSPTFFWRRADSSQQLFQRVLSDTGRSLVKIAADPDWSGTISEFGFLFYQDEVLRDGPLLGPVSLEADSWKLRLELLWGNWITTEYWSQRSVNFLWGGSAIQAIRLPAPVIAWLLLTLLLTVLLDRPWSGGCSHTLLLSGMTAFLAAWTVLDLRWTANNFRQTTHTLQKYRGANEDERLALGLDREIYRFVRAIKSKDLPSEPSRILILGDANAIDYHLFRAKYHLLPHSALVSRSIPAGLEPLSVDYLVFFGDRSTLGATPGWSKIWDANLTLIHTEESATLYQAETELMAE
jgi:hypothetical protein